MNEMLNHRAMGLDELAEYVNIQLKDGRNLTQIAREDFSVNESTIRKRLVKNGIFKRIGNEYIKQEKSVGQSDRHDVSVGHEARQIVIETQSDFVIQQENKVKITSLMDKYDIIMRMVSDYENAKARGKVFDGLVVELPVEKKKDFRVTLRVNDVVYEEFKKFADNNKQFTIKELVSQALKDFVEKYNSWLVPNNLVKLRQVKRE